MYGTHFGILFTELHRKNYSKSNTQGFILPARTQWMQLQYTAPRPQKRMSKVFFSWAHWGLQLGCGRQAGAWVRAAAHTADLQQTRGKEWGDPQEHNASVSFNRPAKLLSLGKWHLKSLPLYKVWAQKSPLWTTFRILTSSFFFMHSIRMTNSWWAWFLL